MSGSSGKSYSKDSLIYFFLTKVSVFGGALSIPTSTQLGEHFFLSRLVCFPHEQVITDALSWEKPDFRRIGP